MGTWALFDERDNTTILNNLTQTDFLSRYSQRPMKMLHLLQRIFKRLHNRPKIHKDLIFQLLSHGTILFS